MQLFAIGSGPPPTVEGGDDAFRLPCHLHDRGWCTVYDDPARPRICSTYRCGLLASLDDGTVDLDRALQLVRTGKCLAEEVRALLPAESGPQGFIWGRVADLVGEHRGPSGVAALRDGGMSDAGVMAVLALRAHLQRHFYRPAARADDDAGRSAAEEAEVRLAAGESVGG